MVNWQFYGEDDKSNTPPPIKKNKFNWTGIPVFFILICVGINKFIGGEMKNNSTNSFIREPVLHTSPVNFVPTNNDFNNELFPLPVSPIIPERDFKFNNHFLVNPQSLKDFSKFRNSNKDINIDPIKSNIVNYDIVQQMSLSSTEYGKGVNEFKKAGLTPLASQTIKPPRVAESPVQFECRVNEVISLGTEGGAGNLVICEVLKMHINEAVLDADGKIDPVKLDAVSRMGGNWYGRAKQGMFEVPKPLSRLGIGFDQLPEAIRTSKLLTGNDLAMLANVEVLPKGAKAIVNLEQHIAQEAQKRLALDDVQGAWELLIKQ